MNNLLLARRRRRDQTRALLTSPTPAEAEKTATPTRGRPTLAYTDIRNVIDATATVEGNLTTGKSVMVDGRIHGDLTVLGSAHMAVIREGAMLDGNLDADLVLVAGTVRGDIRARALRVTRTGCVSGQVSAERLGVDPGAALACASVAVGVDDAGSH